MSFEGHTVPLEPLARPASHTLAIDVAAIAAALRGWSPRAGVKEVTEDAPVLARTALAEGVPPLRHFYFYLTEGCNQACRHCWVAPSYMMGKGTGGHVPVADLLALCDRARPLGLNRVKLTGGEPLLHPQFVALVSGLRERGLHVQMESNLTLLTVESPPNFST
ncbi:hypothetical protein CCP3SC1_310018 [Gammaproteobacteria bacterium]